MLAKRESTAIPNRIHELQGLVEIHKRKEKELQDKYSHLTSEKETLQTLLGKA